MSVLTFEGFNLSMDEAKCDHDGSMSFYVAHHGDPTKVSNFCISWMQLARIRDNIDRLRMHAAGDISCDSTSPTDIGWSLQAYMCSAHAHVLYDDGSIKLYASNIDTIEKTFCPNARGAAGPEATSSVPDRKAAGLCPQCGDLGEWVNLALRCRNGHGVFI